MPKISTKKDLATARKAIAAAIELLKGAQNMADALRVVSNGEVDISQQAVNRWKETGTPENRILLVEKAVSGRVPRYKLGPHIYPREDYAA